VAVRDETPTPPAVRRSRAGVRRQSAGVEPDAQSIVAIEPLAILPLQGDRPTAPALARIDIAPIDVAPVRIRELGDAAE
jgi:hypothetical protein